MPTMYLVIFLANGIMLFSFLALWTLADFLSVASGQSGKSVVLRQRFKTLILSLSIVFILLGALCWVLADAFVLQSQFDAKSLESAFMQVQRAPSLGFFASIWLLGLISGFTFLLWGMRKDLSGAKMRKAILASKSSFVTSLVGQSFFLNFLLGFLLAGFDR